MPNTPPRRTVALDNGLTLFLQEKHDAPVVSFWTWYRVGSRNELPGRTGVSHWVEHMQFKGTPKTPKGAVFGEISRVGGYLNAMTSTDWTAYFETIPADKVDLSIAIESDRMTNSLYDPEEVASERTVILSERQGAENRPTYHLYEELIGAAFQNHAYGHSVIGYEQDLRRMTRNDLYHHYRTYYRPDNAFVTVVGDFDADEMTEKLTGAFSSIENPDIPVPEVVPGGPQHAERRITLHRPSPASYMMMGYKIPGAKHPDIPALMVADAILSGAKTMGMGGGGGMGRSSRLYKSLVTTGLARSAGSSASPDLDESLWSFNATALPGVEPERIEEAIEAEIERLKTTLPSEEEFTKARKQIRAQYVYSQETVTNQAFWLGNMEILDHAARVDTFADEFDAVTPEDVQRVAQTYLVKDKRTIGWQLSDESVTMAGAEMPMEVAAEPFVPKVFGLGGAEVSSHGFVRTELPNGIIVLAQPRPGDGAIDGTVQIRAGHAATGDHIPGRASLTSAMLNRGTANRTFEAFNNETDSLGAMVGSSAGRSAIEVGWHALAEDLDHVLEIAADIIRNPIFPEEELEKVRQQVLTGIRETEQDTGSMASLALQELLYPEGHPFRLRTSGTTESVQAITREHLVEYHARHFGPSATTIALVGGIEGIEEAVEKLTRAFGDWTNDIPVPQDAPEVAPLSETARSTRVIRGKSQADIAIGYPTVPRAHEDYYALQLANLILGQLGLMGRLGAEVRDRNGLAYYATSSLSGGIENSLWSARAGVDPANIGRALEGIDQELRRIRTEPVTDEEFSDAKSYLIGSLPLGLESLGGVTDLLLTLERFGLGLDYLDRYPEIVSALTKDDLMRAMATHIDPDRLAIGIAGPQNVEQAR